MGKIFSHCVGSLHPSNYFVVIVQTPFNFIEFRLSILVIAGQLEPFLETAAYAYDIYDIYIYPEMLSPNRSKVSALSLKFLIYLFLN